MGSESVLSLLKAQSTFIKGVDSFPTRDNRLQKDLLVKVLFLSSLPTARSRIMRRKVIYRLTILANS